jgi:YidC/Oxa1 family membrane protein insertase
MQDLSAPDHLFKLPFTLPFLGEWFNLLPILMTVVWWLQSRLSMKLQDTGAMSDQQRMSMKMMAYMPIIFGVMFYNGASGLVLYWTVSTFVSVIEFVVFRKAREAAVEKAKASVAAGPAR